MKNHRHTILIVDDEQLNLELLKARFSSSGYRILETTSGSETLEKAR
ncbi:MAG: hypothetical protein K8R45_08020 [Desulfobacterales bacterium]|nr:hypothetical protein [Desulfobacterales bacterium]